MLSSKAQPFCCIFFVTTSKAPVTTSVALVSTSFLLLLATGIDWTKTQPFVDVLGVVDAKKISGSDGRALRGSWLFR